MASTYVDHQGLAARTTAIEHSIPEPIRTVLRGVGQVIFQGNALTGACFVLGIAVNAPRMAAGALAGSAIGYGVARAAKFDDGEVADGLYGFNPALVGIASFFFFQFSLASLALMLAGCVAATLSTWALRKLPFPTYTTAFILTTWVLWLIGPALGAQGHPPGAAAGTSNLLTAAANGIGQVMFQDNVLTALMFVVGIALSEWRHAAWVVAASTLAVFAAYYHVTPEQRALDPERVIQRFLVENIHLGLYSYNATLAAVALHLWRKSLIPALLGVLISVPLTELLPKTGLPALTAPFVLATWIVLLLGWIDAAFLRTKPTAG